MHPGTSLGFFIMRLVYLLVLLVPAYCKEEDGCNGNPYVRDSGPLVKTSAGSLVGKYVKVLDEEVAAFLGIPYAHPPVNEKRFSAPCPFSHWEGVLEATEKPRPCMQYSSRNFSWIPTSSPSEDCLYINIWTPAKCCCRPEERLPVMVFFYGGGFYSGSSDMNIYDGSTLAAQTKAIVVSMNYRVGIFGFLYGGTHEAPGNVGLLDQNLAMKWIKTNIGSFGGDPNSITIMGESAGAWSVSLHMVSPMSRHLFNAAIMESGTAYHPQLVDSPDLASFKLNTFAKVVGCITGNSTLEIVPDVMECIKGKSSLELAKAEDIFTSKVPQFFLPVYGDEFLPVSPQKAIKKGHIAPVDIFIGNNRNEATIFLSYIVPAIFPRYSEPLLNLISARQVLEGLFNVVPQPTAEEIYNHYFQNVSGTNSSEIVNIIADAFGDYVFNCPDYFFAEKARNAYFYWFTHRSSKEEYAQWLGVPHFSEVPYVFGKPLLDSSTYTPEDARFSSRIMKMWATFAQKGHPLAGKTPEQWPLFTAENPVAYELSPRQEGAIPHPRAEACEFWRPFLEPQDC